MPLDQRRSRIQEEILVCYPELPSCRQWQIGSGRDGSSIFARQPKGYFARSRFEIDDRESAAPETADHVLGRVEFRASAACILAVETLDIAVGLTQQLERDHTAARSTADVVGA